MIQIADNMGAPIKGLFRGDDGSIVVVDKVSLLKHERSQNNINNLNNEVDSLKRQIADIMTLLNTKG